MIPYLSESLRDFIKPKIVHSISSLPEKYVTVDIALADEAARKNNAVNGYSLVVLNATNEDICSADRYGYVRRYRPCGPNSGFDTYVTSGFNYIGITLTISTYGDGSVEETFISQLARRFGKKSAFTRKLIEGRDNLTSPYHISKEGHFYAVNVRINLEYFKENPGPIFFKELDIVLSRNCNYQFMYHPEQPGGHVFETNVVKDEIRNQGYSKSYLMVENRTNVCREVWVLSGLEVVHLKSISIPDIESGVYINKNTSEYDGAHDETSSFMSFEQFVDGRIAFGTYDEAIRRLAFVKECMTMDEKTVEARRAANRKLELDYMRSEEASKEKKETKYIDTLLTILKYGSIIAAAILIKNKAT